MCKRLRIPLFSVFPCKQLEELAIPHSKNYVRFLFKFTLQLIGKSLKIKTVGVTTAVKCTGIIFSISPHFA